MALHLHGVESFKEPRKLTCPKFQSMLPALGPKEAILLQPLLPQTKSVAIPAEDFDERPAFVAKDEQLSAENIYLWNVGDKERQADDGFA
nr:hypothetical protein [Pseudodesulfovibrio senegalensis]